MPWAPHLVVYSAYYASITKDEHVNVSKSSALYTYDVSLGKTTKLKQTSHRLRLPQFESKNSVLCLEDEESGRLNRLCRVNLQTHQMKVVASLHRGTIDRFQTFPGGYVFVYYHTAKERYQLRETFGLTILKNNRLYYQSPGEIVDATLDTDGKTILTISSDLKHLTKVGPNSKAPKTVFTVKKGFIYNIGRTATSTLAIVFGENISQSIIDCTKIFPLEDSLNLHWNGYFDAYYPAALIYLPEVGQYVYYVRHGMSDGTHASTLILNKEKNILDDICQGIYLGNITKSQFLVWMNPWIGPYKRGGARVGRLFVTEGDVEGRPLTSANLDIQDVDSI